MNSKKSIAFIFFLACACHQKEPVLTDAKKMVVIKQVEQVLNNYVAAVNKDGLTGRVRIPGQFIGFFLGSSRL